MELVVAGRLERRLGKDRILELYLNVVEWGPGVFGAEAAARGYFGRSAASLSLDQAAALAATLPHPLTSNPAHRPSRMLWRKDLILQRLDPTSGIPAAPLPLPEPEIDIGIEPGLEIEPGLDVPATEPPDSAPR
jgi:monofunctional biosynthetic peptidoglycan transglycosylase